MKYKELYKKLLDIGDFIGIEGELFTTQVGEKTVLVKDFKLLSNVEYNPHVLQPLWFVLIWASHYTFA